MNITPLGMSVLTFLARSVDREFYVREVASRLNASVGGTHRVLRDLFDLGLVRRRESGRNVYFRVDGRNPAVSRFKVFVNIVELHGLIASIGEYCSRIVLFGSCATGEDTMESDIDLFLVSQRMEKIRRSIMDFDLDRKINAVVVRPGELPRLKRRDPAFFAEVGRGIVLWRSEDEPE